MRENPLKKVVEKQKTGNKIGIYSCCSANEYVIKAALLNAKKNNSCVLIESTANQCNQYGGYMNMTPKDFVKYVLKIAEEVDFNKDYLFLGGDHLGPLTFAYKEEKEAMKEASELIKAYVKAGFIKIHVDTSMYLNSDDKSVKLSDEVIADRGSFLIKEAHNAYLELLKENKEAIRPVYIIGSEVPIPGGALSNDNSIEITSVDAFKKSITAFKTAFKKYDIEPLMEDVIGVVVQPGIEEKDSGCVEYNENNTKHLTDLIKDYNLVYEAHSTDYQTKYKLRQLVENAFAILKVGPALTFALREALFALCQIEKELVKGLDVVESHFTTVLDEMMLKDKKYWEKYYHGSMNDIKLKRKYSFSDRCRYYMSLNEVVKAREVLFDNLKEIPFNLLSQYMPIQYTKVREGSINNDPESLVLDYISNKIDEYMYATRQYDLYK